MIDQYFQHVIVISLVGLALFTLIQRRRKKKIGCLMKTNACKCKPPVLKDKA